MICVLIVISPEVLTDCKPSAIKETRPRRVVAVKAMASRTSARVKPQVFVARLIKGMAGEFER